MIYLALCDDSIQDLTYVEGLIDSYKKRNQQMNWTIEVFTDSAVLLEKIYNGQRFDIYILDMLMPHKSGIDLANVVRIEQRDSIIIYTTSSQEHALQAYGVCALRYLLKPISEIELVEALDSAVMHLSDRNKPIFSLKTSDGIVSYSHQSIEYAECSERVVHLYLVNGKQINSVFIRQSFETVVNELIVSSNFLHTHKSFVCNMAEIEVFSTENIVMKSGTHIPVSKNKQANVKRSYLSYMANRYR